MASIVGHSQAQLSGVVKNAGGESLSGATVTVSRDSTGAILAYGISRADGRFGIKLNSEDSVFVKVSYIGFPGWARTIAKGPATGSDAEGIFRGTVGGDGRGEDHPATGGYPEHIFIY